MQGIAPLWQFLARAAARAGGQFSVCATHGYIGCQRFMSDMSTCTPIVQAVQPIRKMRGGSQACLLEADDGQHYVTKFQNNPQGRRTLVNELLSACILRDLGIACGEPALVDITAEFLTGNPEIYVAGRGGRSVPSPGLHFGSAYPVDPYSALVYDFLPDRCLQSVLNICEFIGVLVFDKWVSNSDARQGVFFRASLPACSRSDAFVVQMIDNGLAFGGTEWRLRNVPLHGLYPRKAVYTDIDSLDDFQPWLDMVVQFPEERLWAARDQVPCQWLDTNDERALDSLITALISARARVPDALESIRAAAPSDFPNWR